MQRLVFAVLAALCLVVGCAPTDSSTPAEPENSTSQISSPEVTLVEQA